MPKAKPVKVVATKATKKIVSKSAAKPKKGKAVPVKQASKPIKKAPKAAAAPSKAAKRPSAQPKKPMSPYMFFNAEMHTQMKGMPKFQKMTFQERNSVVGQSWGKLTDKQKTEYNKCAEEDKKRYEKELKQLEKKGYFINKDGKDSRDLVKGTKRDSKEPKVAPKKSAKAAKDDRKSSSKSQDDVVKPKKVLSAYLFFTTENRANVLKSNPKASVVDVCKQSGEDWKKMSDAQKAKYVAMQKKDQVRHDKEMKEFQEKGSYTDSNGVNSKFLDKKHRPQEFQIGTVMPKQVASPYMAYCKEQHQIFKAQMKEGDKTDVIARAKQIGETWSKLTAQQKAKYEKLSQKDQERHDKQLSDLRKNGFFTTEDGKKSTDLPFKPKKVPVRKAKQPDSPTAKK